MYPFRPKRSIYRVTFSDTTDQSTGQFFYSATSAAKVENAVHSTSRYHIIEIRTCDISEVGKNPLRILV